MKMHRQDFIALQGTIHGYLATVDVATMRDGYRQRGLSDMRFRWDVLHASGFPTNALYYAGLNDDHIDTGF